MITIKLNELKPSELEGLLKLFYDSEAMGHRTYNLLLDAYAALCGLDELNALMTQIKAEATN